MNTEQKSVFIVFVFLKNNTKNVIHFFFSKSLWHEAPNL